MYRKINEEIIGYFWWKYPKTAITFIKIALGFYYMLTGAHLISQLIKAQLAIDEFCVWKNVSNRIHAMLPLPLPQHELVGREAKIAKIVCVQCTCTHGNITAAAAASVPKDA